MNVLIAVSVILAVLVLSVVVGAVLCALKRKTGAKSREKAAGSAPDSMRREPLCDGFLTQDEAFDGPDGGFSRRERPQGAR